MADSHDFLRLFRNIRTVYSHDAPRRMNQPVQQLDEGRLARPRMADDADEFAFVNFYGRFMQRRPFKRRAYAVGIGHLI